VKTFQQLLEFLSFTLLWLQTGSEELGDICRLAMDHLVAAGHVTKEDGTTPTNPSYWITTLGKACYKGFSRFLSAL